MALLDCASFESGPDRGDIAWRWLLPVIPILDELSRRLRQLSRADRDDAVQSVALHLHDRIVRGALTANRVENAEAWGRRVLWNELISWWRHRRRSPLVPQVEPRFEAGALDALLEAEAQEDYCRAVEGWRGWPTSALRLLVLLLHHAPHFVDRADVEAALRGRASSIPRSAETLWEMIVAWRAGLHRMTEDERRTSLRFMLRGTGVNPSEWTELDARRARDWDLQQVARARRDLARAGGLARLLRR